MLPNNRNFFVALYLLFNAGFSAFPVSAAESVITLNTTGQPPLNNSDMQGFMDRIALQAFKRIGVRLQTVQLPAERGLINANDGVDDGEMSRIAGLQAVYPNLIQVPESIMAWEFVAIGAKGIQFNGSWQGLLGKTVAIINGWKILETNIPDDVQLVKVKNPEQLFNMLQRNRTDLVIYEHWGGAMYLDNYGLSKAEVKFPALAERDMYIYLHKKHQHRVAGLAAALKAMKADGSYEKIKQDILGKYLPNL